MAKRTHQALLSRVNYRSKGRTHYGLWTESRQAIKIQEAELIFIHGKDNVQVESVDKKTGRPVFERNDEDDEYGE